MSKIITINKHRSRNKYAALTETILFIWKIFAVVDVVALERSLDATGTISALKPIRIEARLSKKQHWIIGKILIYNISSWEYRSLWLNEKNVKNTYDIRLHQSRLSTDVDGRNVANWAGIDCLFRI